MFGIGGSGRVDDQATDRPALILVRPAVNVAEPARAALGVSVAVREAAS